MAIITKSYYHLDRLIEYLGQVHMALNSPMSSAAKERFVNSFYYEAKKVWAFLINDHREKLQGVYNKLKWIFMAMKCYNIQFLEAVACVDRTQLN